jgi:hypothetical protein
VRGLCALLVACAACGPHEEGRGTSGRGGGRDLAAAGDGGEPDLSVDGTDLSLPPQSDACAAVSAMATLHKRPVDVIFIVDTSASMAQEIAGINNNINMHFSSIIAASGLDYRVIILADWCIGTYCVCVKPPLGGNTCMAPETKPIDTQHLYHYDHLVQSYDSLSGALATYNVADPSGAAPGGWSDWLRPDALKIFVEVTDDYPTAATDAAMQFDTGLFALTPKRFGTAAQRDYVFYSIVGVKEKTPAML